jgi:Eukaryotic aspartyl protease
MSILYSLVTLLTLCHLSLSIPLRSLNLGKVSLVRNEAYIPNGQAEYLRTIRKYNITPTYPSLSLSRRQEGFVPALLSSKGAAYQAPITIGNQQFSLDFDTGSPDLWVYSVYLETPLDGNHTIYNPSGSAVQVDGTWDIEYNDGSEASGIVFQDTISIGGISISQQAVEAAISVTGDLSTLDSDGLLGLSLAPNTITTYNPTTLDNLFHSPEMGDKLFTSQLTRENEEPGFYTFGYIESTLTPQYAPIDSSNGFWQFDSEYININGQSIVRHGNTAIADTGTTLILLADEILSQIYQPLNGFYDDDSQGWIFPSNISTSQFPRITLPAADFEVTLSVEDFIYETDGDWCYGAFQSRGNSDWDTFGDYWLRNIYAIWDFGASESSPRFGIIPRPGS